MEKNNYMTETRVQKWQSYRDQIKNEIKTYQKISDESKAIEIIEKEIVKIDPNIVFETKPENSVLKIPLKKNKIFQDIEKEISEIINKVDEDKIKKILGQLEEEKVQIFSTGVQDIKKLEGLFAEHRFPRNAAKIKKSISEIEEKHNNYRINLIKKKNHIINIVSNEIGDNQKKHIVLEKSEINAKTKIGAKKIKIILFTALGITFILALVFIILWLGM